MKSIKEEFYFNSNYILELQNEYILNTVKGWYQEIDTKLVPLTIKEIGGKFINLPEDFDFEEGKKIIIEYSIESGITKLQTNERLNQLEEIVKQQQIVIETILEALRYRVDIHTFSTYLKSLENQLGVTIVEQVFPKPYPTGSSI